MLPIILCIETATTNCSVAIAHNGKTLAVKEDYNGSYSHTEKLHLFIQDILEENNLKLSNLEAVAISTGPGSYTGLRIGVSAAKGLCFSLDIPLISLPTLESMARQVKRKAADFSIPILDARRMEVYSAVFDQGINQIRETKAEIIDGNSFSEFVEKGKVVLIGDGTKKCKEPVSY